MTPICDLCDEPAAPGSPLCREHEWEVRAENDPEDSDG